MASSLKTFIALTAALPVTLASAASAQTKADGETWYQSGPWTVVSYDSSRFCRLKMAGLPDGELRLSRGDADHAYFNYEPKVPLGYDAPRSGVEWRFDQETIPGLLLVGRYFQIATREEEAEQLFRSARNLTITQDGETIAEIDLAGSAKAFDQLRKCARQWPGSRVPLAPPPPPPRMVKPVAPAPEG